MFLVTWSCLFLIMVKLDFCWSKPTCTIRSFLAKWNTLLMVLFSVVYKFKFVSKMIVTICAFKIRHLCVYIACSTFVTVPTCIITQITANSKKNIHLFWVVCFLCFIKSLFVWKICFTEFACNNAVSTSAWKPIFQISHIHNLLRIHTFYN